MDDCKSCGSSDITVDETRVDDGVQKLHRVCRECGHAWWTLA